MQEIAELAGRIAELERRMTGTMRSGKVKEVNAQEGWVRLDLGKATGGGDFLSPKVPYAQIAGAMKFHNPPSVGQQMSMMAPGGDWQQAIALPMTWSNENKSPNDAENEHEMTFGSVRILIEESKLTIVVGDSSIVMTDGDITLLAPMVYINP